MLTSLFPWVLYAIAWVATLVTVQHGAPFWPSLLLYVVIFNGGVQGLWGAIGHLCFTKKTAKKIGWTSNGFQIEIGFTNLAMGILGILSYSNRTWVIPTALFITIYYGGCAYNHIKERIYKKNNAPCNSGPMLYSTCVTVITLLIAMINIYFG